MKPRRVPGPDAAKERRAAGLRGADGSTFPSHGGSQAGNACGACPLRTVVSPAPRCPSSCPATASTPCSPTGSAARRTLTCSRLLPRRWPGSPSTTTSPTSSRRYGPWPCTARSSWSATAWRQHRHRRREHRARRPRPDRLRQRVLLRRAAQPSRLRADSRERRQPRDGRAGPR